MCSSRRPEFGRRFELSTSAGPSSQRAFAGVRSLIEFEPPREQRTGFYLSPHFLVCAACAAASKARARHSAGRAGYVYCALSRCAMCACMRASRATARLVRRKSRERKGGPGRTVPPLFWSRQAFEVLLIGSGDESSRISASACERWQEGVGHTTTGLSHSLRALVVLGCRGGGSDRPQRTAAR